MKARLFTLLVLVVSMTLALVPGRVASTAAQSRPAAPVALALSPALSKVEGEVEGPAPDRARVSAALHSVPLMFVENVGQFPALAGGTGDQRAHFQVRGDNATLWLAEDGLWVTLGGQPDKKTSGPGDKEMGILSPSPFVSSFAHKGAALKLSFVGANSHPRLEPFNRLDTRVSYFIGRDLANWRADVPVWGGVRYVDLYPGVDLEVTGDGGRWAWRLVVRAPSLAPFPSQGEGWGEGVRLRVEGADALSLDGDILRLATPLGEYTLPLLQVVGAADASLANPTITGDQVALPFASATPTNPQSEIRNLQSSDLLYSTFLGGSSWDGGQAIAVDGKGNAYVVGGTWSSDFPTTAGAFDTSFNGAPTDIFMVKVKADGTGLAYATFVGGSGHEYGYAIAVDGVDNAYVTGVTSSPNFPTTAGAFDTSYNGSGGDGFVVKLNAAGTRLIYATFLGGRFNGWGHAIAVDRAGSAYVTGYTIAPDFPTTAGAFDTSYNGGGDAFVVKLNADGTRLVYGTFLGGSSQELGSGIAVDGAGSAYVTGYTESPDFPTTARAFDTSYNGGSDAYVARLNADGTGLAYATFLGGDSGDGGGPIAVDGTGSAYVAGSTDSSNFPTTAGAFDTSYNGYGDVFVVKLNASGTGLVYATFLGGRGDEEGFAIALDGAGNAYAAGSTFSFSFPTTVGAFDTSHNGDGDAFVVKLNADGTRLAYATFLGGSGRDWGHAIAVDGAGNAYVTGSTESSDFPITARAFDTSYNGGSDVFVAKISTGEVTPPPSPLTNGGFEEGFYLSKGQSIANGWAAYTLFGQPTFAGERFTAHSGQWAYKISGCAPFIAGLTQAVSVQPGRTYRVTVYYQLYPPGDGQALLGVQDGTSATQWVGDSVPGVWRPLSQVITVTSDRLIITLQGRNGVGLNTNVYFDDVTVTELGQP